MWISCVYKKTDKNKKYYAQKTHKKFTYKTNFVYKVLHKQKYHNSLIYLRNIKLSTELALPNNSNNKV